MFVHSIFIQLGSNIKSSSELMVIFQVDVNCKVRSTVLLRGGGVVSLYSITKYGESDGVHLWSETHPTNYSLNFILNYSSFHWMIVCTIPHWFVQVSVLKY